ncbi:hypothetical protein M405DRAFT_619766 [Rhizopogon salebrosus TDB-379]|nr:hypothetical protein M405DRAFT_619766 [Rhizopogon salebrosus TDB-379]
MACPLRVYRDKTFVEPRDVIEALTGAVVEVYFRMRHYYLRDKKFDTFQAEIQQIKIVKPGSSIVASGFKRRNSNFMESNSAPCFDEIGHSSISVSITGISFALPLVLDRCLYAGTLPIFGRIYAFQISKINCVPRNALFLCNDMVRMKTTQHEHLWKVQAK